MKFNLCTVALAAMAIGVTARPAHDNVKVKSIALRHEGRGIFGNLLSRDHDDDGDKGDDKNGHSSSSDDDDDDKKDDKDDDNDDDNDGKNEDESSGGDDKDSSSDDSDDSSSGDSGDSSSGDSGDSGSDDSGDSDTSSGSYTAGYSPQPTKTSSGSYTSAASSGSSQVTGSSSSGSTTSGGSLPASSGSTALSSAQTVAAGESFDGGMMMYDRGVSCTGQKEGGDSDAVFQIEDGGSLSNVIIGPNQIEGVHCQGACTLTNVWWSAVCEDAFTVKKQESSETTYIKGGGAFGAQDKVIQHNGAGTISISDFTVEDFSKLYRSCGNCDSMYDRHVIIDGVSATKGDLLAGINENYGDSATITNSVATDVKNICQTFKGNSNGDEPTSVGTGADGTYCIYGSDVTTS